MTVLNNDFENFKRCADDAPEGTYQQAKDLSDVLGGTCDELMKKLRAMGLKASACDLIYKVEVSLYDYVKKSNPDSSLLSSAEGFGKGLQGPAADRVRTQAEQNRDALRRTLGEPASA